MSEAAQIPETSTTYEGICPHCHKPFEAELMSGTAARYQGFKCPHCRLFVPFARAAETA